MSSINLYTKDSLREGTEPLKLGMTHRVYLSKLCVPEAVKELNKLGVPEETQIGEKGSFILISTMKESGQFCHVNMGALKNK